MDNNILRNQRYEIGTPAQQHLYTGSGVALYDMAGRYNLIAKPAYTSFSLLIGDVILGIKTFEEASTEFVTELKLDLATAAALANDVAQFLAPLNDPNWQPPADFLADIATDDSNAKVAPSVPTPTPQAPYTPPTSPSTIPAMRTMTSDSTNMTPPAAAPYPTAPTPQIGYDTTPTYQSSQEQVFGTPPQT